VTGAFPAVYGWDVGRLGEARNLDRVDFGRMKQLIKDAHDRIPFKTRFQLDMELLPWQTRRKLDYATTTHWYAFGGATDNREVRPEKVREKFAQPWVGLDDTSDTNAR